MNVSRGPPTYRLHHGIYELQRVVVGELAELQDALPVLVAGVGRVSEVLSPLHHLLQLAQQALGGQGGQGLTETLHVGLAHRQTHAHRKLLQEKYSPCIAQLYLI